MFQNKITLSLTLLLFLILPNQSQVAKAASFDNKINKEVFEEWFMSWSEQFDQSEIFPNSGKNKDVMIPVYEMTKNINRWSKKNLNRKHALISRKDIFKAIPEDKLENI